ncbi:hypothetical protein [Rhodopirellula europaea]|nr:hypothetical protein [Rhodopirellula europaea]MCR9206816.1 hypothetical protein [bacterium]
MKRGNFYASSGVTLEDVSFDESTRTLSIKINDEDGAKYRTNFIATLRHEESNAENLSRIGKVVGSVEGPQASYTMTENELYVQAVITSTSDHHAPLSTTKNNSLDTAGWVQGLTNVVYMFVSS